MKPRPLPWKFGVAASVVVLVFATFLGMSHFQQQVSRDGVPSDGDKVAVAISVILGSVVAFPAGVATPVLMRTRRGLLFVVIALSLVPAGVWLWSGFLVLCISMLFLLAILGGLYSVGVVASDRCDDYSAGLFFRLVLNHQRPTQQRTIARLARRVSAFGSRECLRLSLGILKDPRQPPAIQEYTFGVLASIDNASIGQELVGYYLGLEGSRQRALQDVVGRMIRDNSSLTSWVFAEIDRTQSLVFVDILLSCLNCRRVRYYCIEGLARTVDVARLGRFIAGALTSPPDAHRCFVYSYLWRYAPVRIDDRGHLIRPDNWELPTVGRLLSDALARLGLPSAPTELMDGAASADSDVRRNAVETLSYLKARGIPP